MKKNKLWDSIKGCLFFLMIFLCTCANSSIGNWMQTFFAAVLIALCSRKIHLNKYFVYEIIFVVYILIQLLFGIAENGEATYSAFIQCLRVLIVTYSVYCYWLEPKAKYNMYWNGTLVGILVLLVLYRDSAVNFRLAAIDVIGIFGFSSSTMIALCCAIPCFILMFMNYKANPRVSMVLSVFFLIVAVMTGTRKILPIFFLSIVVTPYILHGNNSKITSIKLVKTIIVAASVLVAVWFLLFNVPLLYEFIGNRIDTALTFSTQNNDASLRVRVLFVSRAIELFRERPILGYGMNYFHTVSVYNNLYSHNNFTELLSGGGVIGLLLYYVRYVSLFKDLIKYKDRRQKETLLLISFFTIHIILEYWQVAYIYSNWLICHSIMLAIVKKEMKGRVNA